MNSRSPNRAKEEGMATISALLIAAVVAVIAAGMLTRQSISTRSLEADQQRVQGRWVAFGGLEISRQILWDARQRDPLTRLDQPWAQRLSAQGFEGRLEDEQGKFNLRNLVANERVDEAQVQAFQRLCELIGVNGGLTERIRQRVIASYPRLLNPPIAESSKPGFDSGRATSPNASHKPQKPTLPMLRSLDDLRSVDGVNDALINKLAPYLTVIPAMTWLNGNTATAPVLAAYVPGLSLERAQAMINERDAGRWFINRGDFVNRLRMPQLELTSVKVGITSDWFRLRGEARRDQRRVSLEALLHRSEDRLPQVIWSRVGV
ncbi:type II secretion system minor pseudopilin GspK [Pseudomonas sp. PB106]|uniref:type II secretion system minor pseudopilin GspK n=1 Tax=Pseudomonas sp. PB106 TaxID=2494699 RepID=UPI00131DDB8B|nr:type II secretion system minor pseudopilin GspK [Pseudomonas sp. PB106]KAE9646599.1 general secretion pathway protein GspK [Pseudomonas sp. PB106]